MQVWRTYCYRVKDLCYLSSASHKPGNTGYNLRSYDWDTSSVYLSSRRILLTSMMVVVTSILVKCHFILESPFLVLCKIWEIFIKISNGSMHLDQCVYSPNHIPIGTYISSRTVEAFNLDPFWVQFFLSKRCVQNGFRFSGTNVVGQIQWDRYSGTGAMEMPQYNASCRV